MSTKLACKFCGHLASIYKWQLLNRLEKYTFLKNVKYTPTYQYFIIWEPYSIKIERAIFSTWLEIRQTQAADSSVLYSKLVKRDIYPSFKYKSTISKR